MKQLFFTVFAVFVIGASNLYGQCPPAGGGTVDGPFQITAGLNCVVNGDLILNKNKPINIEAGASLTINGNFTNSGGGDITVFGTFIVTGTLTNSSPGDITVNGGTLDVGVDFLNTSNGIITVDNAGSLDVGGDYFNGGNGTTNFLDGTVNIDGTFTNEGNGNIAADGLLTVGEDFVVSGNGTNTITGGVSVGGTADFGSKGVDIGDGGVLQAETITSTGPIDVGAGGTINSTSGAISPAPTVDGTNGDLDCTNGCCGSACNTAGDALNESGNETLPVTLYDFTAFPSQNSIEVNWSTASEENTSHFEIYRSYDGKDFVLMDKVGAVGNSELLNHYSTLDIVPASGMNYYKLVSVDFDGYSETFNVVSVSFQFENLRPSPNPFDGTQLNLNSFSQLNSVEVTINDMMGRVVYSSLLNEETGFVVSFDQHLEKGMYFIRVSNSQRNYSFSSRLIVN